MPDLPVVPDLDWSDVRTFINELSSEVQLDVERLSRSVKSFVSVGTSLDSSTCLNPSPSQLRRNPDD